MKNILKNLIAPNPANAIAEAEAQLSSIETARLDIRQRRNQALMSGDMPTAELADAELSSNEAAAGRIRDRIALLRRAEEDAAEAARLAQRKARRQLARDAISAVRPIAEKWDMVHAPRLANELRQITAAETFAADVARETGEEIDSLYSGMAIPARYEQVRRAWWAAKDREGKTVYSMPPVRLPASNPRPLNEYPLGTDESGQAIFATWILCEDTVETMTSPSIPPSFVHEIALLPALAPGAEPHWDKDARRAAEANAEAIVRQLLNR